MEPKVFTGYITKYALTSGIIEAQLQETSTPGMVRDTASRYQVFYHGNDWWRTRADAVKRAESMRKKKIASFEKGVAKLQALDFGSQP